MTILMRFPFKNALYRFMRLYQMPDALALGWIPLRPNGEAPHDDWSVLCAWLHCDCGRPMRVPL